MKTKNLMLGIFAIGSAFASTLRPLPTYIWGKALENSIPHYIYCGDLCNNEGTLVCKVSVPLVSNGSVIPPQAWSDSSCILLMTDDSDVVHTCLTEGITETIVK